MVARDRATLTHAVEAADWPIVIRAVLTGCQVQCARCDEWFPLSRVGLRIFRTGSEWQVRNQPRCTRCRHLTPVAGGESPEDGE